MSEGQAIERLRARTRAEECAAYLVLNPVNLRYLTGYHSNAYSRPLGLVLPVDGAPVLLVPRLEAAQARILTRVEDVRDYVEWDTGSRAGGAPDAEWEALLAEVLQELGLRGQRVAVEEGLLSAARAARLRKIVGEPGNWVDGSGWVETLRIIKSPEEVTNHRRAAALAAIGLDAAFEALHREESEREIYAAAAQEMLAEAARSMPDDPVSVAGNAIVGPRTASLHLPATGNRARPGDLVFVVLVASVHGSWCELSRTVVAGAPATDEQARIFRAVARASGAAHEQLRPGVAGCEVDLAARRSLMEDGLSDFQPMRTGHGLGISGGSESPQLGAADRTPLSPGMVVSIEPSVCIPGFGGVCWADNYVITEAGAEQLSDYPVVVP
jgi:Xaa-Pro aminopeptidase